MGIPAPQGVSASGLPPFGDQANAVLSGTFTAAGAGQPFAFRGPTNISIWASTTATLTTTASSSSASVSSGTGITAGGSINSKNVPPGTTWATFSGTSGTLSFPTVTYYGKTFAGIAQITDLAVTTGLLGAAVTGPGIPPGTTVSSIVSPAVPAGPAPGSGYPNVRGIVGLSAAPTSNSMTNDRVPFSFALTNAAVTGGTDTAAVFTGAGTTYSGTVQLEYSMDGGSTWLVANIGGSGVLAQWSSGTPVRTVFTEPEKMVLYRMNCTAYTSGTINYRISTTGGAGESLGGIING